MADGVFTPAVSVTSAVGGIAVAKPSVSNDIIPISIVSAIYDKTYPQNLLLGIPGCSVSTSAVWNVKDIIPIFPEYVVSYSRFSC